MLDNSFYQLPAEVERSMRWSAFVFSEIKKNIITVLRF